MASAELFNRPRIGHFKGRLLPWRTKSFIPLKRMIESSEDLLALHLRLKRNQKLSGFRNYRKPLELCAVRQKTRARNSLKTNLASVHKCKSTICTHMAAHILPQRKRVTMRSNYCEVIIYFAKRACSWRWFFLILADLPAAYKVSDQAKYALVLSIAPDVSRWWTVAYN